MSSSNQPPNHLDPFFQGHEDEREDDEKEEDDETYHFEDVPGSPSKRLRTEDIQPFKTVADFGEKLSIELVQGGYELIGIDAEPGRDGYIDPIRKAIVNRDHSIRRYNIITLATRCKGPDNDDVLYNIPAPRKPTTNHDRVFPRQYIVRVVAKSNEAMRRSLVEHLADWLNEQHRNAPPHGTTLSEWQQRIDQSGRKRYVVPKDFDRTPSLRQLRKLDDHLCAKQVVRIIKESFESVSATWATDNPELAKTFFSRPYPDEAVRVLGYNNSTPFDRQANTNKPAATQSGPAHPNKL